jgi:hypothetical protein
MIRGLAVIFGTGLLAGVLATINVMVLARFGLFPPFEIRLFKRTYRFSP